MNKLPLLLTLAISTSSFAGPLHLDLEMSSEEYRALLSKQRQDRAVRKGMPAVEHPGITEAIRLGERLSRWIAKVNEGRSAETAIRLTSASTRRGIPIDKPNMYSPDIIRADLRVVLSELPTEMKDVLVGSGELPATIPLEDATFITLARKVDKNYQSAARYKSVDQYRYWYIEAAARDVRGYHYLTTQKIGAEELKDVAQIPEAKVKPIRDALTLVCLNDLGDLPKCKTAVESAFANNTVADLYTQHMAGATANWMSFFDIPTEARRKDVLWGTTAATVPFNTPEIPKFVPYLKDNIEDEFRWNGWGLKLVFGTYADGPLLKFEPGVVPHVNALGGNEIVMDANQPIEEYESQWTIRHEFGHVLGLPDCYHEFYDTTAEAYVNYQLDVTDLMCSRAGNMNERIFLELEEAYAPSLTPVAGTNPQE